MTQWPNKQPSFKTSDGLGNKCLSWLKAVKSNTVNLTDLLNTPQFQFYLQSDFL